MSNDDFETGLLKFFIVRWATMANVVLIYMVGLDAGSLILFGLANAYNLILMFFWRRILTLVQRYPLLLMVDITFAAMLMIATGGSWASPYYLYAMASMVIAALLTGVRYGLALAIYLSSLYMVGFFINEDTMVFVAENNDYDILANGLVGFLLVGIFFGYPVSIIKKIKETNAVVEEAKADLCETKELIAAVVDPNALSCRELEILESLSGGQTNAKIAAELHISEKTVKNHLYKIYKKLGISSREEAIIHYHKKSTPKKDNNG